MNFKQLLLALALFGAAKAEYDYHNNNNNNHENVKLTIPTNEINSLEPQATNSGEDYRTNYQTAQTNAENSQATPTGYDYTAQLSDADAKVAPLFPLPLPVLREQTQSQSQSTRQPEVFPPASYSFSYAVNDESTGDIKDHQETRDGYVVRGSYSLLDADGYKRTVTYTADDIHGFNAIVNRVPYALKKLTAVAPTTVLLDERSSAGQVADAAEGAAVGKGVAQKSISEDSYENAAHERDTTGGIYA